jgi:hypothetical protein
MIAIQINHHSYPEDIIMPGAVAKKSVVNSQSSAPRAVRAVPTAVPSPALPRQPGGFDYAGEAELFPTNNRKYKRAAFGYRRFSRAAEAIRFAIEQLPSEALAGAYLEVREQRFDRHGIRQLYDSDAYPLPRRKAEV